MKEKMSYDEINKLSKIDGLYGFAAIVVVVTGLLNWMKFGKGVEYYNSNTFFIVKFSLFVLVGLLSLYPTILFLKTKRRLNKDQSAEMEFSAAPRVKKVIAIELAIMTIIPLLAELMANGIDI